MKALAVKVLLRMLSALGVEVILPCDMPGAGRLCMKPISVSVTLRKSLGTVEQVRAKAISFVALGLAKEIVLATRFVERDEPGDNKSYSLGLYVVGTPAHMQGLEETDPNRIAGTNTILDTLIP